MAIEFIAWAYKQDVPTTAKFVLVVMADCADHNGYCWPSRKDISKKTGISPRSVTRAIQQLEESGLVKIENRRRNDGYKASNGYYLQKTLGDTVSGDNISGDTVSGDNISGDRLSGDNECNSQGTQCLGNIYPTDISEPSVEPSPRARNGTPIPGWLSESVWRDYESHRNQKKQSLTKIAEQRAIKKLDRLRTSGQDPTAVIEQSLENGWTGLFELKDEKNGKSKLANEAAELLAEFGTGGDHEDAHGFDQRPENLRQGILNS